MYSTPFEFKFLACGRAPSAGGWSLCTLCGGFFCGDHLVVRKGVATCESCAMKRGAREAASGVSAADEDRVVSLLCADVEATIGPGHNDPIVEAAARRRLYVGDPAGYVDAVVDDVQQYFHDAFVDTTWPTCPHHRTITRGFGRLVALRTIKLPSPSWAACLRLRRKTPATKSVGRRARAARCGKCRQHVSTSQEFSRFSVTIISSMCLRSGADRRSNSLIPARRWRDACDLLLQGLGVPQRGRGTTIAPDAGRRFSEPPMSVLGMSRRSYSRNNAVLAGIWVRRQVGGCVLAVRSLPCELALIRPNPRSDSGRDEALPRLQARYRAPAGTNCDDQDADLFRGADYVPWALWVQRCSLAGIVTRLGCSLVAVLGWREPGCVRSLVPLSRFGTIATFRDLAEVIAGERQT